MQKVSHHTYTYDLVFISSQTLFKLAPFSLNFQASKHCKQVKDFHIVTMILPLSFPLSSPSLFSFLFFRVLVRFQISEDR